MRRTVLLFTTILLFGLGFGESAGAFEYSVASHIPERYALLNVTDVEPDQPLDKDAILALLKKEFAKADVGQMQCAVYNKGTEPGDGVRAFAELWKDGSPGNFLEAKDAEQAQLFEKALVYQITPEGLYSLYESNEVAADDIFKNNPIGLFITVPGVSKDVFGDAYMAITPAGGSTSGSIRVSFKDKDPLLRKVKKGSKIAIRGTVTSFTLGTVMMKGEILFIDQ